MGEWDEVGKANWAMKDGALTADKLDGKDISYLVSKNSYKDFQIKAEFWTDEEANSGIFIRCDTSKTIDSKVCYEVNIFDKRPDPTYGTGAIVDVGKVDPMPKAAGKWNTYEITAQGPHLVVVLNGQKTVDAQELKARQRPDRASIWLGRGQIPQGADQAAVVRAVAGRGSCRVAARTRLCVDQSRSARSPTDESLLLNSR